MNGSVPPLLDGAAPYADDVMEFIIKPALAKYDVVPVRSDQMVESGTITEQMFREIAFFHLFLVAVSLETLRNLYLRLPTSGA